MKLIKLLPLAAFAFAGLASASARISTDVPSIVVQYDANTLLSVAGAETLHRRLRAAAETVCSQFDGRSLGQRELRSECVRDAVARSVADVNNPNLTSYHRNHGFPRVAAN